MRVRIHRGAAEIGGNCIEIAAASGQRIVLDIGRPLSAGWDEAVVPPAVPGLDGSDASLCGVVVSHPHLDHYGLISAVDARVPVFIGQEAASLVHAASFFSPAAATLRPSGFLRDRVSMTIGPFTVTPFLNDHSAFDAYSLLIEADGRRLFYSGDLRAHGRKAALFERLLTTPPTPIDALMLEGTHVRSDATHDEAVFETETELEGRFANLMSDTRGAVAVMGSAQNLDRLVTVFRAARRSGRQLVVDLYGATVAAAVRPTIPQVGFEGLRVFVPRRQRVLVKESGEFERVRSLGSARVFLDELASAPDRFAFHVPTSTVYELLDGGVLDSDGAAVWSMWHGYQSEPSGQRLAAALGRRTVPYRSMHTSGHASVVDLQRLVAAFQPGRVVPMHSSAADRFAQLFPRVERHLDNEWWAV